MDRNGLCVLGIRSTGQGHACVPFLSRRNVNALFDLLDQFQPDVVHAHEPVSLGLMGQVWAAMNDVPFVYTSHVLPSKSLDFGASRMFEFLPHSFTQTMSPLARIASMGQISTQSRHPLQVGRALATKPMLVMIFFRT